MTLWTDLSAADQQALLLCANRRVSLGCELLDPNLNFVADLSNQLQLGSGSVKWTAATTDQRDAVQTTANLNLVLSSDLAWGRQLIRLSKTVTDPDSGLSATGYLGVHMLPFPDRVAGAQVQLSDGTLGQLFSLSCQDRSAQLDRIPGADYTQADGQTVVAAMKAVLDDAGVTGYLIDGTVQSMMPTGGLTWAFDGQQKTFRAIFNDLADLISYDPVYSGPTGLLRSGLNTDPSLRQPSQTLDVQVAGWVSPLAPKRTRKRDLSSTPNQWHIEWVDANGTLISDPASPFTDTNYTAGEASVGALGGAPLGLRPAQKQQIQASSADDFTARCQAQVASDIRGVTEYDVATVMWPELPHSPVFAYRDPQTTGSQDSVKTVATSCEIQLSEQDSTWTLQEVSS